MLRISRSVGMPAPKTPVSRSARNVAEPERRLPRNWASTARTSSRSPTTMSATVPPLAAMMTAVRNKAARRAMSLIPGSAWQKVSSRAKPPASRERIMFRASLRFLPPVSNQPSEGRMTSAPTMTTSELVMVSSRVRENLSCRSSQLAGPSAHRSPAASAPLACQRWCQVRPGCSCNQSSISIRPRRRKSWLRESSCRGVASPHIRSTPSRSIPAADQCAGTGRGGNFSVCCSTDK